MYIAGAIPASLRQISANAFTGAPPKTVSLVDCEPFAVDGVLTFVDPDDHTDFALLQGGLFYFFGDQTARIMEIRALTALGNISAVVGDIADQYSATYTAGGGLAALDFVTAAVVPTDVLTITIGASTATYNIAERLSATQLRVDELGAPYSMAVGNTLTIKDITGVTTRLTVTLAGAETIDVVQYTTHDTPVGTPATSRLVLTEPMVIQPHQCLKVSTASANALGWVDVYAVKGSWF